MTDTASLPTTDPAQLTRELLEEFLAHPGPETWRVLQRSFDRFGFAQSTRVITVRLPERFHQQLTAEAQARRTSVNRLCLSKLLRTLPEDAHDQPR